MKLLKWILANKITSLIITISLTGVILLSVSTVKVIQVVNGIKTEQISTTTTESVTENTTENTTAVTATETTTESTTESTTVTTTKPKTTTTTKAPDPKITSSNVKEVFIPLICHYTSLKQNLHYSIGLDYNNSYTAELMDVVCEETEWTEMSVIDIYKFKTVKTVADVKKIYKKYLSSSIVNQADLDNDRHLFSYNGELYRVSGAIGTIDYDVNSIAIVGEQDGGYLIAIDTFIGAGTYSDTETFLVKSVNGRFIIDKFMYENKKWKGDVFLLDAEGLESYY